MADHTLNNVRITQKNDTKTNWSTKNPVLLKGEVGIEFDPSASDNSYVVKFKIGDGTNHWNDLTYFGGEVTLPAPDDTSIEEDNNTWSIAGFTEATANKFPVKRINDGIASIEWVALPSHIANLDTMYTKLSGIEEGAQVNTVISVNGQTDEVTLTASDVGAEPAFTKNTAFNKNFETNAANIKVNGTAAVGTSSNVARADHVHPTDTSRAAAADLTAHTGNTNNPHNVTAEQIEAVSYGDAQTLSTDQKTQARSNIGAEAAFTKNTAFNKNFETTAANIKANGTASAGTSSNVARADHVHPTDTTRAAASDLTAHTSATNNPHSVTATQVGAVSYSTAQTLTDNQKQQARTNIGAGTSSFSGSYNDLTNKPTLGSAAAKDVPVSGDAATTEVVMGNDSRLTNARPASDVSAWAKESTKPTYNATEVGAIPATEKGAASGVAELDANGKVPSSQLPSYVDDVLEYANQAAFPAEGEAGKIYVAKDTNLTYRWGGTGYVEISPSLALGTTSSTAYRGDLGDEAHGWSASSVQTVNINGTALTKSGNDGAKSVNIPIASTSALGVVKASTSENTVDVDSTTGVMTVNDITTDKIVAGSNTLILDCGNATI